MAGTTPGVVRVGDTVRRPAGPWTTAIDALLGHLEKCEFPTPRPLGRDDQNRQVLTWLPGETTWEHHHRYWSDPDQLRGAARLVRRLHDALDTFEPPADAVWRGGWGRTPDTVGPICHWDLAPYNVVVSTTGDLGVIDWDGAGPGDRMAELSFAMDGFVPLRRDAECRQLGWPEPPARVERLELFWDAYGLTHDRRAELADALVANARDRMEFGEQMYAQRREPFASWWAVDQGAGDRDDLAVTERVATEWRRRHR